MPLIFMHLSSLCLMSAYLNGASAKQQPLSINATKTLALQKLSFVHSLFLHSEMDGMGKRRSVGGAQQGFASFFQPFQCPATDAANQALQNHGVVVIEPFDFIFTQ